MNLLFQTEDILKKIEFDPSNILEGDGIFISIVGYIVVFLALLLLYMVFVNLTKFLQLRIRRKLKAGGEISHTEKKDLSVSGEINAAISTALYLHLEELESLENTVLTIKKVQRVYSPWSSKLYGLRKYPRE
jgi:glutaconyl-CoA/methylmalonyl-CoA decarboxylase subunit delta